MLCRRLSWFVMFMFAFHDARSYIARAVALGLDPGHAWLRLIPLKRAGAYLGAKPDFDP